MWLCPISSRNSRNTQGICVGALGLIWVLHMYLCIYPEKVLVADEFSLCKGAVFFAWNAIYVIRTTDWRLSNSLILECLFSMQLNPSHALFSYKLSIPDK